MADIFLSYAREEQSTAENVANHFKSFGWTVFWDHDLKPGDIFESVLLEEIVSARCFVVLLSRSAVKSPWVSGEISVALDTAPQQILPCKVDDAPVPIPLRGFNVVDLTSWDGSNASHCGIQDCVDKIRSIVPQFQRSNLTPHFRLFEFERVNREVRNTVPPEVIPNLRALCSAILEPLRDKVGPIMIISGYHSPAQANLHGRSTESLHGMGEAAIVSTGTSPGKDTSRADAWASVLQMMDAGFPIDQAFWFEDTPKVLVTHTARRIARRQAYVICRPNKPKAKSRVVAWDSYRGPLKSNSDS